MSKTIEYFFTHASPWTYLGSVLFHDIAKKAGAQIVYRPVNLGKVFPVSGGLPLGQRATQRQTYRMFELARWREFRNMPLTLEPAFFPVNDSMAARMVIAADQEGSTSVGALSNALLRAVWAQERNIADEATAVAIADEQGLNGAALLESAKSDSIEAVYETYTQQAIERQVFGAPTYIIDGEPFWGQDRLDFVERALAK